MKHGLLVKLVRRIDSIWNYLKNLDDIDEWHYLGENSIIDTPLVIDGKKHISVGDNTHILRGLRLQVYNAPNDCETEPVIQIGSGCYIGFNMTILGLEKIKIGNDVLMASNILISSENHGMDPEGEVPYKWQELHGGVLKSVTVAG